MKKKDILKTMLPLLFVFTVIFLFCKVNSFAKFPGGLEREIWKGDSGATGVITVSSFSATAIIPIYTTYNHQDWLVKNDGSYSVWIGTYTPVLTTGTGWGYGFELEAGATISIGGKNRALWYANILAGSGNTSNISILLTTNE